MQYNYNVAGATCQHCVKRIVNALEQFKQITNVNVNLTSNTITFNSTTNMFATISPVLQNLGYTISQ